MWAVQLMYRSRRFCRCAFGANGAFFLSICISIHIGRCKGAQRDSLRAQQMFQAGQLQTVRLLAALSTPDAVMQQA